MPISQATTMPPSTLTDFSQMQQSLAAIETDVQALLDQAYPKYSGENPSFFRSTSNGALNSGTPTSTLVTTAVGVGKRLVEARAHVSFYGTASEAGRIGFCEGSIDNSGVQARFAAFRWDGIDIVDMVFDSAVDLGQLEEGDRLELLGQTDIAAGGTVTLLLSLWGIEIDA